MNLILKAILGLTIIQGMYFLTCFVLAFFFQNSEFHNLTKSFSDHFKKRQVYILWELLPNYIYRISSYSCRGNYSFLNSSSEETIQVFVSLM